MFKNNNFTHKTQWTQFLSIAFRCVRKCKCVYVKINKTENWFYEYYTYIYTFHEYYTTLLNPEIISEISNNKCIQTDTST